MTCSGAFISGQQKMFSNEVRFHRAEIPAVNGITNARSVARIYASLIGNVEEDGEKRTRLLSDKTIAEATKNITPSGESDRNWYNLLTIYSKGGFQIYGERFNILAEDVFGHAGRTSRSREIYKKYFSFKIGFGGSCAFAVPSQHLAYGYVCNHLDPGSLNIDPRNVRVIKAIENILNIKHKE